MRPFARGPSILFVSNGNGEDAIAADLVRALPRGLVVDAYPMIGAGSAYEGVCPIVGPRAEIASQGWRNVKGSLRRDVAKGGLGIVRPAIEFLKASKRRYDTVVVVGDMTCVILAAIAGLKGLVYLDVYKTGAARLYSRLERWVIARTCRVVFNRAEPLAALLRQSGVDARAAGNVMMDTIPYGRYDAAARRRFARAVTLLPGSRQFTPESFALQVAALRRLPARLELDVFAAIAGGIDISALAQGSGLVHEEPSTADGDDLGALVDGKRRIALARGRALGNLFDVSDIVLSQAGTATIQAIGLGLPAITVRNPRDRASRFEDEQKLFGEARLVVPPEPQALADAMVMLLDDGQERARRAASGRAAIGGAGAIAAILPEILRPNA